MLWYIFLGCILCIDEFGLSFGLGGLYTGAAFLSVTFFPAYASFLILFISSILCSGLKGRRPFWLLNPPSRGGGGGFLACCCFVFSSSGDEEVES